ncbi:MAG: phosphoribosyltransferase [Dehalococcoidia bacterium]|nr:phosphoribosyltransferase [Dehalococcoidia bacterium]
MGQTPRFRDRADAGRQLAEALRPYASAETVVLAVPRGGVPVAIEVARRFNAPLDVVVTRKIPIPGNPEAGYGAVAEDGEVFLNQPLVAQLGLSQRQIERQAAQVLAEIERRTFLYRGELPRASLAGKTALIIDDGLASGFTMVAAARSVKRQNAARIVVASPVASGSAYQLVEPMCDAIVCIVVSHSYPFAVASFYRNWYDLTDDEVTAYLQEWQAERPGAGQQDAFL